MAASSRRRDLGGLLLALQLCCRAAGQAQPDLLHPTAQTAQSSSGPSLRASAASGGLASCAGADDPSTSLSDFNHGRGGWSCGNTSAWAWRFGCEDGGAVCSPTGGAGYMLAVGEGMPLISPLLRFASCMTLSYFANPGVELAVEVEAQDAPDEWSQLVILAPTRVWKPSPPIALTPNLLRVRVVARASRLQPWLTRGAGVDNVVIQLRTPPPPAPDEQQPEAAPIGRWLLPRSASSPVGVDVSTLFARRPPSLAQLSAAVRSRGLTRAKVFQYDAALLSALAEGGVLEVVVGVPNLELHSLALSPSYAERAVESMAEHAELISQLVVGNEPLASWWGGEFEPHLPLAVSNVQAALAALGWQARVGVSLQADVLLDSWPPSAARFDPERAELLQTVLPSLARSGGLLLLHLYPFLAWSAAGGQIGLDFASFQGRGCVQAAEGLCYANLLDAMVDASSFALRRLGLANLSVALGEAGWPTGGEEPGAHAHAACAFTNSLVAHAAFGRTPLGRRLPPTFLFELVDEGDKSAAVGSLGASERHYGLLAEDTAPKFSVDWTPASEKSGALAAAACPPLTACSPGGGECAAVAEAGQPTVCFEQRGAFCLPAPNASDLLVASALDWLCAPASAAPPAPRSGRPAPSPKGGSGGGGGGGAPSADERGGGVDCAALNADPEQPLRQPSACASAPLRAKAAWAATRLARARGSGACLRLPGFEWAHEALPSLESACPLGVCEASLPPRSHQATAGASGGACLVARDCGGTVSSLKSVLVAPSCDHRPPLSAVPGSCHSSRGADPRLLLSAINWACSSGGVDCTAMRELCASAPLRERATWVFTRYASSGEAGRSCSFAGLAELSSLPLAQAAPSCDLGVCRYPSENIWQAPLFTGLLLVLGVAYAVLRLRASAQIERELSEARRLDQPPAPEREPSLAPAEADGLAPPQPPGGRGPEQRSGGAAADGAAAADTAPPSAGDHAGPMWAGKSPSLQML